MKIAVLSNVNMDPFREFFNDAYITGYNQYMQELKNTSSCIWNNHFDILWLHLDTDLEDVQAGISIIKEAIVDAKDFANKRPETLVIVSELIFPQYSIDHFLKDSRLYSIISDMNVTLKTLSNSIPNLLILPVNYIVRKIGYSQFFCENFWYLGRIKYSGVAFDVLSIEINRLYRAYKGKIKKVLVLDLDNTIWGGIIGEDGLEGIVLSEDGKGKIFRDFQKNIKLLKEIGVLLCIVSKNNYSDVSEVFDKHTMMVLRERDFIAIKVNWLPKHNNIKEIAKVLNLGLDSFVFIDDNPFERKLVKEFLPEVVAPDFPDDITNLNSWFWEDVIYEYFPKISITKEDKAKVEQYKRNIKRGDLQGKVSSYEEFLDRLNMRVNIHINDSKLKIRLAQLTQKTNQFNLTTKRYTVAEIEEFMRKDCFRVYALEYDDMFGSEGIVGEAIIKIDGDKAFIDTFLLSCRIIGRNVEFRLLDFIVDDLKSLGIKTITGEYIPTKKNIIVKDFYREANFNKMSENLFCREV